MLIQFSYPLFEQLHPSLASVAPDTDLILLRRRFAQFRADEAHYAERLPGFGASAAVLHIKQFPQLRVIAVDFMSISSPAHEAAGADVHHVFLGYAPYTVFAEPADA